MRHYTECKLSKRGLLKIYTTLFWKPSSFPPTCFFLLLFFPPPFYTICTVFYHTVRSFFFRDASHCPFVLRSHSAETWCCEFFNEEEGGRPFAADSTETTGNVSSLKRVRVQKYCLTPTAPLLSVTSGQARQSVEKGRFVEVFLWFWPGVGVFFGGGREVGEGGGGIRGCRGCPPICLY